MMPCFEDGQAQLLFIQPASVLSCGILRTDGEIIKKPTTSQGS
jgi:hypothetical protein